MLESCLVYLSSTAIAFTSFHEIGNWTILLERDAQSWGDMVISFAF